MFRRSKKHEGAPGAASEDLTAEEAEGPQPSAPADDAAPEERDGGAGLVGADEDEPVEAVGVATPADERAADQLQADGAAVATAATEGEDGDGAATEGFDVVAVAEAQLFGATATSAADDQGSDDASVELRAAIEAICMVADQPVPGALLADVLDVSEAKVDELCQQLANGYREQARGFVLAKVAGGYRFQSHPRMATHVERFVLDGQSAKLSGAALETLAIVAYKQPLSRAQISAIRGVNVDGVLKTLQQRGYVTELGQDPGPGQAMLFGTTSLFLEKLGIAALSDLPPLGEFIPDVELVEALEQTLRPSTTIDLRDDLEDDGAGSVEAQGAMDDQHDPGATVAQGEAAERAAAAEAELEAAERGAAEVLDLDGGTEELDTGPGQAISRSGAEHRSGARDDGQ